MKKTTSKIFMFAGAGLLVIIMVLISVFMFLPTEPIRIGVIVPVETQTGVEVNQFFRFANSLDLRSGASSIVFEVENPVADKTSIQSAFDRFADSGVSAIIGGILSQDAQWIAERSIARGIPAFGISASSITLSGLKDNFYRITPTNDVQAQAVADYYNQKGYSRLTIVGSKNNKAYVDAYVKVILSHFSGNVVLLDFKEESLLLEEVTGSDPEAIFGLLDPQDMLTLIRMVKQSLPQVALGSSSWASATMLTLYDGPLLEDIVFFALDQEVKNPEFLATLKRFADLYTIVPTNGSMYAVSIVSMLQEALNAAGRSPADLINWLNTPRIYATAYGPCDVDQYGDTSTSRLVIMQYSNGTMFKVDRNPNP